MCGGVNTLSLLLRFSSELSNQHTLFLTNKKCKGPAHASIVTRIFVLKKTTLSLQCRNYIPVLYSP